MNRWIPPSSHVGAPSPADLFQGGSPGKWNLGGSGPITSASVNPFLTPIAQAEIAAKAAAAEAVDLADHAAAANEGYALAFSKIQTAANKWRDVRQLALGIEKLPDAQPTPEETADLAQAKLAVPGILQTVAASLGALVTISQMLQADQSEKRPDLPPAKQIDPDASDGPSWGALAIAGGIAYLLYKAVF